MLKKIVSIIVLVCVCSGMFGTVAFASSGSCGDNATWSFADGVLTVSGTGDMNVDYNPPWADIKNQIKKVVIEDGITSISRSAFGWCTNLESVYFGKGIKEIGQSAFLMCGKLNTVELPSGITKIEDDAFSATGVSGNQNNWIDGVFYIGTYAISANDSKTPERLVIKDGTTLVSNLYACRNIKIVELPASVVNFTANSFHSTIIIEGVKGSPAETIANEIKRPFFEVGTTDHVMSGTYENISWKLDFDENYLTLNGTGALPSFYWSSSSPWGGYYEYISTTELGEGITSISDNSCFGETIIIPDSVTEIKQSFSKDVTICGNSGSYAETYANANGLLFRDQGGNITAAGTCGENAVWKFNYNNHTLTISGSGAMTDYDERYDSPFFNYGGLIDEIVIGDEITHLGKNAFNIFSQQGTWIILPDTIQELDMNAFTLGSGNSKMIFYCPDGSYAASWAKENAANYEIYGEYKEIRVETSEELFDAIGSNRKIIMTDGLYKTSEQLLINHRRDLSIVAENSGKAEILSNDGYRPVVTFKYSSNASVSGIILGHQSLRYQSNACGSGSSSSGYVVCGEYSRFINVNDCDLYGCGTIGVFLYNTYGYKSRGCVIRDCKENIVTSDRYYYPDRDVAEITAEFSDCIISGNAYDEDYASTVAAMNISDSTVTFDKCTFINNLSTVRDSDEALVKYTDCIFEDNVWQNAVPEINGVCLNGITWEVESTKNEWNETFYTLRLGFPLTYESGTIINSEKGTTLPYSESSLPWKKYENITNLELADGVKYGGRCGKGLYWEIDNTGTLSVTGTGDMEFDSHYSPWQNIEQIIKRVIIGDGVTCIPNNAFAGCINLAEINLPDSIAKIGNNAFSSCKLSSVKLPAGLNELGESAFGYNSNLSEISISETNGYFTVDNNVLFNKDKTVLCFYPSGKADETYAIPQSVTEISNYAFSTAGVKSVTLNEGLVKIGNNAFGSSDIESVKLPATLNTIGIQAFSYCNNLKEILVADGNQYYSAVDGVLYNNDKTELILYPGKKPGTEFTVPAGVTTIGDEAINNVSELVSVTLSDGVKSIGEGAFGNCDKLLRITIPASVTEFGNYIVYPHSGATVFCDKDSAAHEYCIQKGLEYSLEKNNIAAEVKWQRTPVVTVALPSDRKTDGYVIAAIYDDRDNSLVDVKKIKVIDSVVSVKMDKSGEYIKAFWLDVDNNVEPLSDVVILE